MPVPLVPPFVLDVRLKEKTPIGGYVVVYFFQEDNVHRVLGPMLEEISRRSPISIFLKIDGNECSENMLETYQVSVYPTFLVYKYGQLRAKIEVSTKEGLVVAMKREGVLKESEEITNVM